MLYTKDTMAKSRTQATESNTPTIIDSGTEIIGDITSNGDVKLDGKLTGNIIAKGRFILGATGTIEGNVSCSDSTIQGKIKGKLTVKGLLALKSTANLLGDIITSKLSIEPGAIFTGTCNMDNNNAAKREEK